MPGAGGRGVELIVGRTARSAERGPSSASWPPASSIAHLWACLMPASAALVPSVVPHRSLQRPRFAVRTQNCTQHRLRASQYAAPISQTHKKHACPCQAFSSSFRPVDSACFIHLHIPGRTRTLDSLAVVDKKSSPPGPARALPSPSLLCIPPSGFGRLPRQCSLSPIHHDQPPLLDTAPSLAPSL